MKRSGRRKKRGGSRFVLGLMLFLVAVYFLLQSSIFNIKTVTVEGNNFLSSQQILDVAAIRQGTNIWKLDEEAVSKNISLLPQVKTARIIRKFPRGIVLQITERNPVAVIIADAQPIKLDRYGIDLGSGSLAGPLPVISGVQLSNTPGPGEEAKGDNLTLALEVAAWLDELGMDFISEIDVADAPQVKAYTQDGIEIRLGDEENLETKISTAQAIIKEVKKDRQIDYVDVSSRPVVKLK